MSVGVRTLLVALLALAALPACARAAERPRPAAAFVDSVGVNVHATYGDTAYGDWRRVVDDLRWLGVRHVRDGLKSYPEPAGRDYNRWQFDRFNRLAQNGIRATVIMGWPGTDQGSIDALLGAVRTRVPDAVEALEGPNEFDMRGIVGWPAKLRAYQADLYRQAKADPATARLPVIAPSLVSWQSRRALGDVGAFSDVGNLHPYPAGRPPGGRLLKDELTQARWMKPHGPLMASETGYHNAVQQPGGQPPTSERAARTYLPALLLTNFARGLSRTFLYELLDEKPDPGLDHQEQHWGLFHNDHSPKPAAQALRGLLGALADPGPPFGAGSLDYRLEGRDGSLRHVLLQKRDGTFQLVLWRSVSVWDPQGRRALSARSRPVVLAVRTPLRAAAAVRVRDSVVAVRLDRAGVRRSVAVGADPVVVSLTPAHAPAPRLPVRVARVRG